MLLKLFSTLRKTFQNFTTVPNLQKRLLGKISLQSILSDPFLTLNSPIHQPFSSNKTGFYFRCDSSPESRSSPGSNLSNLGVMGPTSPIVYHYSQYSSKRTIFGKGPKVCHFFVGPSRFSIHMKFNYESTPLIV